MAGHNVYVQRVYDEVRARGHPGQGTEPHPGERFLVDGMWPRGVRKSALEEAQWAKDVAPSRSLRSWFGHDPERFAEFADHYRAELAARPEAVAPILDAAYRGPVVLLYAAKDTEHNNAVVLRDYLQERLSSGDN